MYHRQDTKEDAVALSISKTKPQNCQKQRQKRAMQSDGENTLNTEFVLWEGHADILYGQDRKKRAEDAARTKNIAGGAGSVSLPRA